MECITRFCAVLVMVLAVAACQPVAKQRIAWDINTWTHECFGDRTVSCVNRKVKINLRIIDYSITQIKESNVVEKDAGRPSLDDDQLEAGLAAIDEIIVKAARKQRPGLFARWFLGSSQYWDVPRFFTTEFITQEMVLEVFAAAVLDYNRQHNIRDNTVAAMKTGSSQTPALPVTAPDSAPAPCSDEAGCQNVVRCEDANCDSAQAVPSTELLEATPTAAPAAMQVCDEGESLLFSCATTNQKQVLLCDAGDALYYSFGRHGQTPELSLKIDRNDASTTQWQGTGRAMNYSIDIPNANTVYSLFWSADRITDDHAATAGVNVRINGRQVATVECTAETVQQSLEGVNLKPSI